MGLKFENSKKIFARAQEIIPGGVNSPVRAFKSVGGDPPFIDSASGCRITDVDGNEYLDYVGSWGPMILGHAYPPVIAALAETAAKGTSFGAPTALEVELAEQICRMVPSVESVRLVNSGTEATMSAIRLARGVTGRKQVIKFDGCYHGHADSFLISAGSGVATLGIPGTPGVTEGTAADTLVARFNSLDDVAAKVGDGSHVAAVIVEPIAGNMGVVPPAPGFLEGLRKMADEKGFVLIFDEVMTGFRVARGGAQDRYGVTPDLTTLGKVVGGGLPIGAYAGKKALMNQLAPVGPVYQAGTLSGNPLATTAGLVTLRALMDDSVYERLERSSARLEDGLKAAAAAAGEPVSINRVGSMMTMFFTDKPVNNFDDAKAADSDKYARFFRGMLQRGIALAPSAFEAAFISTAHDDAAIDQTVEAARATLAGL